MSNTPNVPNEESFATTTEVQAAIWLEQDEFGQLDQAALATWLARSWEHRIAYWRMKAVWGETNRLAALRTPMRKEHVVGRQALSKSLIAKSVAALTLLMAVGASAFLFLPVPASRTFSTELGARKTLTLTDGSQIELNTNTTIRIARDQREAEIYEGEAYFQIKHDPAHPFSVIVGDRRVTDLGTKFVIRHDIEHTRIALVEGLAELQSNSAQNGMHPIVLTPGDVALANGGVVSVVRKSNRELEDQLGWRHGLLIFYHTTLADAATEFNRYNQTKLVIAGDDAAHRRINGTFLANNVEAFGHVMQVVLGLHVQTRDNNVVVSQ